MPQQAQPFQGQGSTGAVAEGHSLTLDDLVQSPIEYELSDYAALEPSFSAGDSYRPSESH